MSGHLSLAIADVSMRVSLFWGTTFCISGLGPELRGWTGESFQEERKDLQEVNASASVCSLCEEKPACVARDPGLDGSAEEKWMRNRKKSQT